VLGVFQLRMGGRCVAGEVVGGQLTRKLSRLVFLLPMAQPVAERILLPAGLAQLLAACCSLLAAQCWLALPTVLTLQPQKSFHSHTQPATLLLIPLSRCWAARTPW